MSDARNEIKIGDAFTDQETGLKGKVTAVTESEITVQYLDGNRLIEETVALDEGQYRVLQSLKNEGAKKKIADKTKAKCEKKVVKEDSEAAATIAPNSMPADKMQVLNMAIAGILSMTNDDAVKWFETTLGQATVAGRTVGGNCAANQASIMAKPSNAVNESLTSIFEGEELSEAFKTKASTLFEAAVSATVLVKEAEMEAAFATKLDEATTEIKTTLNEKTEAYLDYIAAKWLEENAVAIESSLRNELTASFIDGLKDLFAEHYVDVPDEKVDVLAAAQAAKTDAEAKLNEALTEIGSLKKTIDEAVADATFDDIAEGLALTQKEKLRTLTESVAYEGDADAYGEKLKLIKEAHFKVDATKQAPKVILEDSFNAPEQKSQGFVDPSVARIAEAMKARAATR